MIEFKKYRKVAPTFARVLTVEDHEERHGVVQAPEGLLPFVPGDYLARDAKGEWVIRQATIQNRYQRMVPEDEEGFAQYLRTDVSFAAAMPEPFVIDGMRGKAGDYLIVNNESGGWPVDREIFEQTYQLVE
ncbi:hypothetical protein EPA93_36305 [Ktedonosporobacter rubrisoli]|uniref:Uncharacterized protein n=1 Tax=Ktedonosporobacter rubrisoli TaxID=2509675 RepID=A0A4P6K145_KTERU|nr:hypothetical protein [Ktedonosporobacter rubrisoli]QBD81146.1 hypothetical protein EPA93_36305 [Ktedonosporobacter rubrisoli]